jgi:hypothetical protein
MERRNLSNLRLSELFNIAKLLDIKYRVLGNGLPRISG